VVSTYLGTVAAVHPFPTSPGQVTCEFVTAGSKSVLILTVGKGSPAAMALSRATTAGGGRKVASVAGLGVTAFSISSGGLVRGMEALDANGVMYVVSSTFTAAQDEAMIKQLIELY
jgi:hypothetical protein